jgi:hypothetical protein
MKVKEYTLNDGSLSLGIPRKMALRPIRPGREGKGAPASRQWRKFAERTTQLFLILNPEASLCLTEF